MYKVFLQSFLFFSSPEGPSADLVFHGIEQSPFDYNVPTVPADSRRVLLYTFGIEMEQLGGEFAYFLLYILVFL